MTDRTRKLKRRPLILYALLYSGTYGQTLHSLDYPAVWSTLAAIKRYIRDAVPEVKHPIYRIGKFKEVKKREARHD